MVLCKATELYRDVSIIDMNMQNSSAALKYFKIICHKILKNEKEIVENKVMSVDLIYFEGYHSYVLKHG